MVKIYMLKNLITGKIYIGQTTTDLGTRFKLHISWPVNKELRVDIPKYGIKNFSIAEICTCPDTDAANKSERFFIYLLGAHKPSLGYNKSEGGKTLRRELPTYECERIIAQKIQRGKPALRYFIDYELFRLPEAQRKDFERVLKQKGYLK